MKMIKEGEAEILDPPESLRRKSETFYNPDMEYQRDLTMSALRVYLQDIKKAASESASRVRLCLG